MIRPLRARHRWMAPGAILAGGLVFAAGLASRPSFPLSASPVSTPEPPAGVALHAMEAHHGGPPLECASWGAHLLLRAEADLGWADPVAYWSPGEALVADGGCTSEGARLLGPTGAAGDTVLAVPGEVDLERGHLAVFSDETLLYASALDGR